MNLRRNENSLVEVIRTRANDSLDDIETPLVDVDGVLSQKGELALAPNVSRVKRLEENVLQREETLVCRHRTQVHRTTLQFVGAGANS